MEGSEVLVRGGVQTEHLSQMLQGGGAGSTDFVRVALHLKP